MNKKILLCFLIVCMFCVNVCMAADFNMSYLYGGTVSSYIQKVDATNGVINEVSPSYFDLTDSGNLKITGAISESFINAMHERGVSVVPFLSNHWARQQGRNALNNREELANQIVEAIEKYNLDGVNVDLENLTEADRENYTDFVRILSEKMPEGKTLAVAVAANPNGYMTGWHGSYDYERLGIYSDYLMIMAYDEHYQGGTQGPVASYDFVEDSIKYSLKYVPSEKVVVGLAFFGRYWNEQDVGGRGVAFTLIEKIFNDYPPTITYDEESKTMIGTIHVSQKQANEDDYIFAAGTYNFYYETAETIKEKLELVEKYNLKGTGSWALGQELPSMWEDTSMWLGNKEEQKNEIQNNEMQQEGNTKQEESKPLYTVLEIFKDVTNKSWAAKYIDFVYSNKLMIGLENNLFGTEQSLTRAETVTILSRLVDKYDIELEESEVTFAVTDIANHWAKQSIDRAMALGMVVGYEDNTFRPDEYISREELVTILDRLNLDITQVDKDIVFTDVKSNQWSYNSIISMAQKGLIDGYEDNTFKPQNNMQRQEIATILYKICNEIK